MLRDAEFGSELMPESEEIELGIYMLILLLGGWLRVEEETDLGLLLEEKWWLERLLELMKSVLK